MDEGNVKTTWEKRIADEKVLLKKENKIPLAENEESATPKRPYYPPSDYQRTNHSTQNRQRNTDLPNIY